MIIGLRLLHRQVSDQVTNRGMFKTSLMLCKCLIQTYRPAVSNNFNPVPLPSASTSASTSGRQIIVFGFPPSAESLILHHFQNLGPITYIVPPGPHGNWLTITYADSATAARAVRNHGKILGNNLMIAVRFADITDSIPVSEDRDTALVSSPKLNSQELTVRPPSPSKGNLMPATAALRKQPTSGGLFGLFGAAGTTPNPSQSLSKPLPSAQANVPSQSGLMNTLLDKIFGFWLLYNRFPFAWHTLYANSTKWCEVWHELHKIIHVIKELGDDYEDI